MWLCWLCWLCWFDGFGVVRGLLLTNVQGGRAVVKGVVFYFLWEYNHARSRAWGEEKKGKLCN